MLTGMDVPPEGTYNPISPRWGVKRGWMRTPAALSFVVNKPPQRVQKLLGRKQPKQHQEDG